MASPWFSLFRGVHPTAHDTTHKWRTTFFQSSAHTEVPARQVVVRIPGVRGVNEMALLVLNAVTAVATSAGHVAGVSQADQTVLLANNAASLAAPAAVTALMADLASCKQAPSAALIRYSRYIGKAIDASRPMIATTIISSIKVKPWFCRLSIDILTCGLPLVLCRFLRIKKPPHEAGAAGYVNR